MNADTEGVSVSAGVYLPPTTHMPRGHQQHHYLLNSKQMDALIECGLESPRVGTPPTVYDTR